MLMKDRWYEKSPAQLFEALASGEHGLTTLEVTKRLGEYGPNALSESKPDSVAVVFVRQFRSPLIYILLGASALVYAMGDVVDGSIIMAVLLFNAIIGAVQEGRAQNTLKALRKYTQTSATVMRDGKETIIPDAELVPGDVVMLYEGVRVPADARVIVSHNLQLDEAALTGESKGVFKTVEALHTVGAEGRVLPTAEQKNTVFKGTHVLGGSGVALVVATGVRTVLGKIAEEIAQIHSEIPLQANIRRLSYIIIGIVAVLITLIFLLGVSTGKSAAEMFVTVVAVSVSLVPSGLPVVITLVLASGVWRMSKRNALVKKLQAVEALGQAKVIAVDKTGTLTKNEMVVQRVFVDDQTYEVGGTGYEPQGEINLGGVLVAPEEHPEFASAVKLALFCASARVLFPGEGAPAQVAGDPTEAAMLVLAQKVGFHKEEIERAEPLLAEIPFDSKLRYHATLHAVQGKPYLSLVGAPEVLLGMCKRVRRGGRSVALTQVMRQELEGTFLAFSKEGLRVVALAERRGGDAMLDPDNLGSLTFVGFLGMKDALRPEVADAMAAAQGAGIRVVMITGDHAVTAVAIATEAGIYKEGALVLTGADIDELTDKALSQRIRDAAVFARVTPEHKLRIIKAYKARGEVVAMTGDGVNDAPSLVAADLGVAMGKVGTEVAKEAADIVLLDDNFGSIVSAVEEGRSIYKTIKKVILYLFSTSAGEALTITIALFLGYPVPLLAAQIIWLNFVTDGFLTAALAMEPKEKGLLSGAFARSGTKLLDAAMVRRMLLMASTMAIGAVYLFGRLFEADLTHALTMSLTVLAAVQWFNAWNCRSERESIFTQNPFSNPYLVGATALVIGLQLLAVYHPLLQQFLHTAPLSLMDWLVLVPVAASIVVVEELRKFVARRRARVAAASRAAARRV